MSDWKPIEELRELHEAEVLVKHKGGQIGVVRVRTDGAWLDRKIHCEFQGIVCGEWACDHHGDIRQWREEDMLGWMPLPS